MADLSSKKSNHISLLIQGASSALDAISGLRSLVAESKTLGYDDADAGLQDADFVGANNFLSASAYRQIILALSILDSALTAPNSIGADSFLKVLYQAKP